MVRCVHNVILAMGMAALATAEPATGGSAQPGAAIGGVPAAGSGNTGTQLGTGSSNSGSGAVPVGGGGVGGGVGGTGTGRPAALTTAPLGAALPTSLSTTRTILSVTQTGIPAVRQTGTPLAGAARGTGTNEGLIGQTNLPTQSGLASPSRGSTQNNGSRNAADKAQSVSLVGLCVAAGAAVFGTFALA
ncbi:hypothetical protein CP532_3981 [Ophiocordyceps camponoti-leonardi (nom. inval.)]|nr:hypothetical protein CP532_3981 [Ophiocordyceps camponoti-leonardi (nom. inval.)]